jgi:hypothetical protein
MGDRQQDAPTEMIREMGLDPQMLDKMQQQQQYEQQPHQQHQQHQPHQPGMQDPGFQHLSAQQQMEYMNYQQRMQQQAQAQAQAQAPPEYDETSTVTSTESSEMDLNKLGLSGGKKTLFDIIISKLKGPLVVAILFIIFSLIQVDGIFRQFLPPMILGNSYYYLAIKGLVVGAFYLATSLFIDE